MPICRVTCVWKKYIVIFQTITLEIVHSHPRYHIYAIISSVVITDWPCVATYQMYFVWSARRCLDPHWLRAAQSHFGTAPAPGHVRQVNNLVFWVDDATATASSVVGYASDTASAVAKVEPNSNRSRETGRPYYQVTSTRTIVIIQRSRSWLWMINSLGFRSMSIDPLIPDYLKIWQWQSKFKVMWVRLKFRRTSISYHVIRTDHF